MTKHLIILLASILLISCQENFNQDFASTDIDNFWNAYDKIIQTEDTLLQAKLLNELYLDKASDGLKDIIEVRRYTEKEFLIAINSYPKLWKSIRANTLNTKAYHKDITNEIKKLKDVYPDLKPTTIYFTMGAFRTNGTTKGKGSNVLIGSELALADDKTIIDELPEWRQPFYKEYRPLENIALLCTHEYIHTQQEELVENLLSSCLYEGVAEFISCHATGKPSNSPAIDFGKKNEAIVVKKFVEDLYLTSNLYNWIWGTNRNELKVRDLGYYVGYEISERYYNQASDKTLAIKELIELDYHNEKDVERIVDASKLFPKPIIDLYNEHQSKRPTVTHVSEFEQGSTSVDPNTKTITVNFSEVLNGRNASLDYGPLGENNYPKVLPKTRKWGSDNQSYSFEVKLEPNKKYQVVISNFRLENGTRLIPYTIEFQTTK